jgi:hypothetical protein
VRLDESLARLLGYYLSEGCSNTLRNNIVSFSFHVEEKGMQLEVSRLMSTVFGVTMSVDRKKKDRAIQLTAYNKALAFIFSKAIGIGRNSYDKRVPDFVYSTGVGFIRNLLDTYFGGDGYFYAKTRHAQVSTASQELAYGVYILLRMVNNHASIGKYGNAYRIDLEGGDNFPSTKQLIPLLLSGSGSQSVQYRPSVAERVPAYLLADEAGVVPSQIRQHIGGGCSSSSRISLRTIARLGAINERAERLMNGDIQCLRIRKIDVIPYSGSYYNIETDRQSLPNYMHGFGIFSHNCSTKIPYKTVGKEYIADRPEIEREIKNAAREALRRLGIYLSRKGSMQAVQRKMNIYSKYVPLIAKFATELADKKRLPNYQKLIGEGEAASSQQEAPLQETGTTGSQEGDKSSEAKSSDEIEVEQKKIDEYRGS